MANDNVISRLCRSMRKTLPLAVGIGAFVSSIAVHAVTADQAKRIHDRLTGNMPSPEALDDMLPLSGYDAARYAIDNDLDHSFYNVTLKNWAAPWTNRDFDSFADLNDYIATVIGFVRDADSGKDFRGILYENSVYVGADSLGVASYSVSDNRHYEDLEEGLAINDSLGFSLRTDLEERTQSSLYPSVATREGFAFPAAAASGVVTSRAGAKAFLIAGTNRAAFRFTMLNHLCLDMEQVHDVTRTPDRIRQDVSRSPGGDSSIFLNSCIGCHNGMDPMAQALAYHTYFVPDRANDPTGEDGQIEYTDGVVQPKYFNNNATFPQGFITPDDSWANYWRDGKNASLGWDSGLPGAGQGASGMFEELAHTQAFAQCHVKRVFETVCLREPAAGDVAGVEAMITDFMGGANAGDMKHVFATSAVMCMGN